MSEVHIRINKQAFERTIFVLIIIGLAIFAFTNAGSSTDVDPEQITSLEEQVQNLTSQNTQLVEQLSELQTTNSGLQDEVDSLQEQLEQQEEQEQTAVEPETQEPQLSGELDISYDASIDENRLNRVVVAARNGLESTQRLEIGVKWNGVNYPLKTQDITVQSGDFEQVIFEGDTGLGTYIPPDVSSIKVTVTDDDEELVVEDWIDV